MRNCLITFSLVGLAPLFAAGPPTVAQILDGQLKSAEREFVSLVEAMPADKFSFAPTHGAFEKVRTFGQQATHVAYVNYAVASAVLGEANPSQAGENENGPANLKSKDDIVKYVKDSFAYAHKAMATLTSANATGMVKSAFGNGEAPRLSMANVALWHTFDHYGQMVVYSRMNNVVPPASRQ